MFDSDHRMVTANSAYLAVFDGIEEVRPGLKYGRALELIAEEGIVDLGTQPSAEWQAEMLERWNGHDPEPRTVKLFNGEYIKLIDRPFARRGYGIARHQYHRNHPARGGTERSPRAGRGCEPREIRVPRQHEP